jgi:lysophospholipase L1-like esterase
VEFRLGVRNVYRFAVALCAAGAFVCSGAATYGAETFQLTRTTPLRIMALGDSITAGVGANGSIVEDGGYRGPLAALLARAGYHLTFVGSRSDYSKAINEKAHEGWPGFVLRSFPSDPGPGQLYGPLVRRALNAADPDIVLLMAGTNDMLRLEKHAAGYTLPNILTSMDMLLAEIFAAKPNVYVIVAPVVDSPKIEPCVLETFAGAPGCGSSTENLQTIVTAYAQRGFHVTLAADMSTAVPRDSAHFPDGIHPCGAGGYAAVAGVWLRAIEVVTRS